MVAVSQVSQQHTQPKQAIDFLESTKTLLIDAAVGKSSCVERFVKNEFFEFLN